MQYQERRYDPRSMQPSYLVLSTVSTVSAFLSSFQPFALAAMGLLILFTSQLARKRAGSHVSHKGRRSGARGSAFVGRSATATRSFTAVPASLRHRLTADIGGQERNGASKAMHHHA